MDILILFVEGYSIFKHIFLLHTCILLFISPIHGHNKDKVTILTSSDFLLRNNGENTHVNTCGVPTLNIPAIDNVRLDVLANNKNSLNSRKKAINAPRNTRPRFLRINDVSVYAKKSSFVLSFIPVTKQGAKIHSKGHIV